MHSAAIITLLAAASTVVATPLHQLFHKRAIVTDIVTDIVVVTVTANGPPSAAATTVQAAPKKQHTHTAAAPPPPPSSAAPSVVIVTVPAAAPSAAPASSVAPVKVAAPASSAAASSAAAAPAPPAPQATDYTSTAVFNHNQHRANHSASDMAWNQTLADWAAITAKTCHFAHDMSEGTQNYGQNIAAYGISSGVPDHTKVLANAITDMWYYGEVDKFPFGVASPSTTGFDFLHFSQAVWKGSQTVGCATQTCGPNTVLGGDYQATYTVCNYFPAGNMMGDFVKQVTPSTGKVGTLVANI